MVERILSLIKIENQLIEEANEYGYLSHLMIFENKTNRRISIGWQRFRQYINSQEFQRKRIIDGAILLAIRYVVKHGHWHQLEAEQEKWE